MATKADVTAWFVSDLHLKDINERSSIILLRFLRSLLNKERPCTHLFLLGDIFDLWISDAAYHVYQYQAFVDLIVKLRDEGVQIVYFEGNHDVHVKHFWQEQLGIPTYTEAQLFQLGPWSVRAEHGDMINLEDKAYQRYRGVIRSPQVEKIAPLIAGRVFSKIGELASKVSRKHSSAHRQIDRDKLRQMIRDHAEKTVEETPFDYIITGHMHIQDEYDFKSGSKTVHSINLGSWFDGPKALCLNEAGASFVEL